MPSSSMRTINMTAPERQGSRANGIWPITFSVHAANGANVVPTGAAFIPWNEVAVEHVRLAAADQIALRPIARRAAS